MPLSPSSICGLRRQGACRQDHHPACARATEVSTLPRSGTRRPLKSERKAGHAGAGHFKERHPFDAALHLHNTKPCYSQARRRRRGWPSAGSTPPPKWTNNVLQLAQRLCTRSGRRIAPQRRLLRWLDPWHRQAPGHPWASCGSRKPAHRGYRRVVLIKLVSCRFRTGPSI